MTEPRLARGRLLALLLALVLAASTVILAGASVYRRVETFQPVGFTARPAGAGWLVEAVSHPATGLRAGDQVFQVDGRDAERRGELFRDHLRAAPESQLLVTREGELTTVTYRRPPLEVDWAYLILTLVGAGYLLVGLYTLLRRGQLRRAGPTPQSREAKAVLEAEDRSRPLPATGAARQRAEVRGGTPFGTVFLFFLWCLASAAVFMISPAFLVTGESRPEALDKVLFLTDQWARVWLPALTLHLFLVFPHPFGSRGHGAAPGGPRLFGGRLPLARLLPFIYLPAAVFTTLELDLIAGGGALFFAGSLASGMELLGDLELLHWILFGLASVVVLGLRLLFPRHGLRGGWEQERQVQWIALGLAGGYLPFAALYLGPWLLGFEAPQLLRVLAVLPLGLVPLAFAWAILRYKLWDIGVIVRDTLSSTVTLLLGILAFSLVHLGITRGLGPDMALARNLLSFLAGLSIAGLLIPARQVIGEGLARLQYRGHFLKRRALADLAEELLRERDLPTLCRLLARHLEEAVPLQQVNLYLAVGPSLRPVRPEPGLPAELADDDLGERVWRDGVHPMAATSLPASEPSPQQRLFLAGYRYVFPLKVSSHRVGLVVAGYKPEDSPLNSDDVELIRQLLDQASLAIENAQLVGQLTRRLDEVSRLQEYSEGIFESSPAGIVVLDPRDRIVSANRAFARLTAAEEDGETPEPAALAGRPLEELLPVRPLPAPGEGLMETSYCDMSGREHYLQLSISSFPRGREQLRILVIHDTSERAAMENALRESERLAALGMLAAGVAHEVNTPITGISSYAQMLMAETEEDDPRYDLLRKVERQTFRAARIVNNLLEFARNTSTENRPLEVAPLIGETLELLKERLSRRQVRVEWEPPREDVRVMGNAGELQQVLTNLFLNASDAMERVGGGTLGIEVEQRDAMVCIAVTDTGVGIPPERLETIFQPFFSTKLRSGGTGLGLSISHEIVRRHGGDIRVESRPGEGSRFLVELPTVDGAE